MPRLWPILAAIFPEQSSELRQRLLNHDVKHWIADTFEGAQIVTDEWPLILFQETGSWPPPEEVLQNIFVELSKSGWGNLIPRPPTAKTYRSEMKFENKEYISTPYIKDAAFYVDIFEGKEVLLPSRVDRFANAEIQGLTWSLHHTRPLVEVLYDEKKWVPFVESVRQTPGAGLSIEKDVLTPKKKALQIINRLSETATWDQIRKEIEAAVKANHQDRDTR